MCNTYEHNITLLYFEIFTNRLENLDPSRFQGASLIARVTWTKFRNENIKQYKNISCLGENVLNIFHYKVPFNVRNCLLKLQNSYCVD